MQATKEQHGVWPYRVMEVDRITYFAKRQVAVSYAAKVAAASKHKAEVKVQQHVLSGAIQVAPGGNYVSWLPLDEVKND